VNGRDSTLDEFLAFTRTLYSLAVSYGGDPTSRVLEYLRFPKYQDPAWTILIGSVDDAWVGYVNARVPNPVRSFLDPATRMSVNLDHFAATAHAVYLKGTGPGTASTRGDFGGWAGDLCTLYGEWRYAESSYASGYLFVEAKFAKLNVESTFALTDYIQDCDGQLIGNAARAGGRIDDVIAAYMTGTGPATRFKQFYQTRHGGTVQSVFTTAKNMLQGLHGDVALYGLQTAAMVRQGGVVTLPVDMPDYKLDPFVQGYADAVERLSRG
jgi:hypothetical protein